MLGLPQRSMTAASRAASAAADLCGWYSALHCNATRQSDWNASGSAGHLSGTIERAGRFAVRLSGRMISQQVPRSAAMTPYGYSHKSPNIAACSA